MPSRSATRIVAVATLGKWAGTSILCLEHTGRHLTREAQEYSKGERAHTSHLRRTDHFPLVRKAKLRLIAHWRRLSAVEPVLTDSAI
jgi:hypothetical protein